MDSIQVTDAEIDEEKEIWLRDGLMISKESAINIIKDRKERELWTEDGSLNKKGD